MRAVLDANVFVSALLSRAGVPAQLIEAWLGGQFDVVVCAALLEEVERTLASPKLRGRVDAEDAAGFVAMLRARGDLVPDPTERSPVSSRDPGDDYLIALAARERVPLVSGDAHLLELAPEVPVFAPRHFQRLLEERE